MAVSPFQTVVQNLDRLGAFEFIFPFLLTSAVFYGLLRKSKIFGEPEKNIAVNGIVALVAGFMVLAYPVLTGVNPKQFFVPFILQSTIAILVIVVGLMISSLFIPEGLSQFVGGKIGSRGLGAIIAVGVLVGAGILISSGAINIFLPPGSVGGPAGLPPETVTTIVVLLVLVLSVAGIIAVPSGKKT